MLNEWVFDARLMEQEVTRFFIPFHTDTILIDRPIDPVASPLETLLPLVRSQFVVRLSLVYFSFVSHMSFVLIRIRIRARRFLRLQSFLIHAAIDNRFRLYYIYIYIYIICSYIEHSLDMDTLETSTKNINIMCRRINCAINIQRQAMKLVFL